MELVRPTTITDAMLTSSNVPETDYSEYAAGTTYALDAYIIRSGSGLHHIWKSLQGSNVGNTPETSPTWWVDQGATNRWKMFDGVVSTQTTVTSPITVVIAPGRVNSIALLNLTNVGSVTISMLDAPAGATIYNQTTSLVDPPGSDWYAYFYDPITTKTDFVVTDIPLCSTGVITITLTATSGTVSCGVCAVGNSVDIGTAEFGSTSLGIVDYSRKDTDSFGNTVITPRRFVKTITAKLYLTNSKVDYVSNILAGYRSTPVVWIGSGNLYTSLIVYGFYKSFSIDIAYPTVSYCSLNIEGIT